MPTYNSNVGGGFQGPASDYWMYGLADQAPSQDRVAHFEDQAQAGYLQQIAAKKAAMEQQDYEANAPLREATRNNNVLQQQLGILQNQGAIDRAPIDNQTSLAASVGKLSAQKQESYKRDMDFISENFPQLEWHINNGEDPAKVYEDFMQTMGVDKNNPMAKYTPQSMDLLKKLSEEHALDKPGADKTLRGIRENNSLKGAIQSDKSATILEKTRQDNIGRVAAAGARGGRKPFKTAPGVNSNGETGITSWYQNEDGSEYSTWSPAPKGTTTPEQSKIDKQDNLDMELAKKYNEIKARYDKDRKTILTNDEQRILWGSKAKNLQNGQELLKKKGSSSKVIRLD